MDLVNEQYKITLESLKKMKELSLDKVLIDSKVIEDNCNQVNETIKQKNEICDALEKEAEEIENEVELNRKALKLYKEKLAKLEADINHQDKEIEIANKNIETYKKFIEESERKYPFFKKLYEIYEVLSKNPFASKSTELKSAVSDDLNKLFGDYESSGSGTSTTATKSSSDDENDQEETNSSSTSDSDVKSSQDHCLDGESQIGAEFSDDKSPVKNDSLKQDQKN